MSGESAMLRMMNRKMWDRKMGRGTTVRRLRSAFSFSLFSCPSFFCFLTAMALPAFAWVQGAESPTADDKLQDQAAAFLQSVVNEMRIRRDGQADAVNDDESLRPRATPILRYSDPARVYPAAGVWRLGDAGRPPLLVSLEYWLRADTDEPRIMFEFISFTDEKLELKADDQTTWRGDGGAAKFASIEKAPQPAALKNQRLIQMRSLARRFTATEKHMGDLNELRLLPQPIDRYDDKSRGVQDAAIFVFAYGTNPELVLLIEAVEEGWQYAPMRMTWAELAVKLDDAEVASFEQLSDYPKSGAYQTAGHVTRALNP